jgi:hypothetical protein
MSEEPYRRHLAEIRQIKERYTDDDHCALCGVIRERLVQMPDEPPENGVCCSACLAEHPELRGMTRDQVAVWLYERWGDALGRYSGDAQKAGYAARAWLRVQAAQGRRDAGMADVAAAVFGLSDTSRQRLREYVAGLGG